MGLLQAGTAIPGKFDDPAGTGVVIADYTFRNFSSSFSSINSTLGTANSGLTGGFPDETLDMAGKFERGLPSAFPKGSGL